MKFKNKKKGFTIVELVIVIAIIGILAAILIPTFVGLVQRAKLTADQRAVSQMNLVLKTDEVTNGIPESYDELTQVLHKSGYNVPIETLSSGYEYVWDLELNRVFLYNKNTQSVEYPDELKDSLNGIDGYNTNRWFSLSITQNPIVKETTLTMQSNMIIYAGTTFKLEAYLDGQLATEEQIEWSLDITSEYYSINSDGTINVSKETEDNTTFTVIATTKEGLDGITAGKTASCQITIKKQSSTISPDYENSKIIGYDISCPYYFINETINFSAVLEDGTNITTLPNCYVKWDSSNPNALSIDANGNATILKSSYSSIVITATIYQYNIVEGSIEKIVAKVLTAKVYAVNPLYGDVIFADSNVIMVDNYSIDRDKLTNNQFKVITLSNPKNSANVEINAISGSIITETTTITITKDVEEFTKKDIFTITLNKPLDFGLQVTFYENNGDSASYNYYFTVTGEVELEIEEVKLYGWKNQGTSSFPLTDGMLKLAGENLTSTEENKTKIENVVFGYYTDEYNAIIKNATRKGEFQTGIDGYWVEETKTIYILSENEITAPSNLRAMFGNCYDYTGSEIDYNHAFTSLKTVRFENFNVSNISDIRDLFADCTSLTNVYVTSDNSNWTANTNLRTDNIFKNCDALLVDGKNAIPAIEGDAIVSNTSSKYFKKNSSNISFNLENENGKYYLKVYDDGLGNYIKVIKDGKEYYIIPEKSLYDPNLLQLNSNYNVTYSDVIEEDGVSYKKLYITSSWGTINNPLSLPNYLACSYSKLADMLVSLNDDGTGYLVDETGAHIKNLNGNDIKFGHVITQAEYDLLIGDEMYYYAKAKNQLNPTENLYVELEHFRSYEYNLSGDTYILGNYGYGDYIQLPDGNYELKSNRYLKLGTKNNETDGAYAKYIKSAEGYDEICIKWDKAQYSNGYNPNFYIENLNGNLNINSELNQITNNNISTGSNNVTIYSMEKVLGAFTLI